MTEDDPRARIRALTRALRVAIRFIEQGGREKDQKLRLTVLHRAKDALGKYGHREEE